MGIRTLFRAGGLRPAWTYAVAGTLWRVIPAPPDGVVGEERDTKAKRTTFFALDLPTGRVRWHGRRFHDGWWVGVSAVHRGVLLLHGFATPDMPGHRGLMAADVRTGNVLWSDPACSLVELRRDSILLSRPGHAGPALEERALRTGAPTRSGSGGNGADASPVSGDAVEIRVPDIVDPEAGLEPRLDALLGPLLGGASAVGPLEIIDHPRALIVMNHERASPASDAPGLRGRLRVLDPTSGASVYEEIAQTELHVPVQNTFSVVHNMLLYVKDGRSLRAIPL